MKSIIKSKFNRRERINIGNAPRGFESVDFATVKETTARAKVRISAEFPNFPPQSLKQLLGAASNEYSTAYDLLEEDFQMRRGNLELAFDDGYAQIYGEIDSFKKDIDLHNQAYEEYLYYCEKLTGYRPSSDLRMSNEEADKFMSRLQALHDIEEERRSIERSGKKVSNAKGIKVN